MSRQVFVKRDVEKISLIVDGITPQTKRIPGGDRTRLTGPLYVGGVPASVTVRHASLFNLQRRRVGRR